MRRDSIIHRKDLLSAASLCAALCLPAYAGAQAAPEPPRNHEIDVAMFGGAHFFSGDHTLSRRQIGQDPNSAFQHSGIFGLRLSYLPIPRLGIEAELGVSPTQTRNNLSQLDINAMPIAGRDPIPNTQTSMAVFPIRLHLLVNILTGRFRPFVLAGLGGHIGSPLGTSALQTDATLALHAGAGAMFDIKDNWGIRLDGRFILTEGVQTVLVPEGELLFSFYGRFWGKKPPPAAPAVVDADGDGVPDGEDACPGVLGLPVNSGCPDKDTDGDSIVDRLDKCPQEAGVSENGGCADMDGDGDGVVNRLDKCPDKPGVKDNAGCPPRDADADGLPDAQDRCPTEAGVADNGGCPDKDQDADGVVDRLDKCVDKPETKNSYQDDDGCPDEIPKAVQQFTGAIQGITFQAGKAVILPASYKVLDKAVTVLKDNPTVKLEIAGHTDNTGDAQKNTELSQARADAVRKYLIDKGVAEGRLKSMGYGPSRPAGDNKTAVGRGKNRRVEFTLIQ